MRDIRNDVGILSETISGIGGAARTMTFAFTAPMVALGTFAVQAAGDFDASMRNINSILGLSESQFAGLSKEAFDFARTTRAGVTPAVDALYEVFSAGITDQERAMEIWKISNQVSEAGLADLSQTTNIMTATMSAFNLETDQATRVGNVWTRTVQQGVGSLSDFLSNAQKVLPLSNELGVSLEDMGASIAFLSQGGGGASKAETAYAMMLSNMLKPTKAMSEAFDRLNVKTGTELIAKFGSIGAAVKALKDSSDELDFNKMFSKTGLEAALRMTNNFDALQESIAGFNTNLDDATMDAWTQQAASFNFQLDLMKTALQGAAVTIGQKIIPLISPLVSGFTDFFNSVSDANPQLLELGVIFIAIVAGAAPLIWLLTSLLNPVGLLIAGVTTLSAAFATNFMGIQTTVLNAVNTITGGLQPLKDAFDAFMAEMFPEGETIDVPTATLPPVQDFITINPQDTAISLWDFYSGEGAIEKFSWTEFQQMAKDAGWDGGAIKPGDVLKLLLPGGDPLQLDMGDVFTFKGAGTGFMPGESETGTPAAPSMIDRFVNGIEAAWPKLQTALDTMWANVKTWVTDTAIPGLDELAGSGLNALASIFVPNGTTGEGNSPLYDALTDLLSADIGGAIGNVGTYFTDNFPTVTTALGTFVTNLGAWLSDEGIPTVARSVGYFIGKLAVMLSQGISSLWALLTNKISFDQAGAVTGGIGEAVVTPLGEGFNDAIKDANLKNPIDELFTSLSGALVVAAGAWVVAPQLISIIGSKIWGAITSAVASNLAANTAAGAATDAFETAFAERAAGFAAIGTSAGGGIVSALMAVLTSPITWGITVGALVFNALPPEAKQAIHDFIGGAISAATGGEGTGEGFDKQLTESITKSVAGVFILLGRSDLAEAALKANGVIPNIEVPVTATPVLKEVTNTGNFATDFQNSMRTFGLGEGVAGAMPNPNPLNMDLATQIIISQPLNVTATDTAMAQQITPEAFTETAAAFQNLVPEMLSTGTTGQDVVDTIITPIASGFQTGFAPDAPAVVNWTTFVTNVSTGGQAIFDAFSMMSTGMVLLETDANTHMPVILGVFLTAMQKIKASVMDAGYQLTLLAQRLAGLDGTTIQVTTQVMTPPTDGSHAGGLNYVPYDGYIAELHKGERVLTAAENSSGQVTGRAAMAGGNSTSNTATFNVYANSFDDIIREARRRGYSIGR